MTAIVLWLASHCSQLVPPQKAPPPTVRLSPIEVPRNVRPWTPATEKK